jgi:hypothetical protein
VLRVSAWLPQLPATLTVDQRTNGSQWTSIGSHLVGEYGITVVVGNDGATNTFSVADGVSFTPAGGDSDRDGDGLPDWWERWHFLSETAASPTADSDGDGHSNQLEYLTGCDPDSASSRFDAQLALDTQSGGCSLRWPSAEGIRYCVEGSSDCKTWEAIEQNIVATPPTNQFQAPIEGERRFFRVVVEN